MKYQVKLGVAPTRRNIFSREDALKYKELTLRKLEELGIDFVDINQVNSEGLLFSDSDVDAVINLFKNESVDAVFFPHVNFGTEDAVCKVARALNVPVLLWGPRDEAPLEDGTRLRDSQCGLFATGKVMRRFNVPFSYIVSCRLSNPVFERGLKNFIAASNVVKEFCKLRILQIAPRPADFWTMMCNEGELLEKFGIQVHPVTLSDLVRLTRNLLETGDPEVKETVEYLYGNTDVIVEKEAVNKIAALKTAMRRLAAENRCAAVAIQCWTSLQAELQVMPCVSNSLLSDEGIPVVCETDIHGAISAVMAQAAAMGKTVPFFADWTVRHPTNENGELLQHCGPWPLSLAKKGAKPKLGRPMAFPEHHPGSFHTEIEGGQLTMLRFDGDHGEYSLLLGLARGVEGPYTQGTYLWVEVEDWPALEEKLVAGPYVHHCVGIHGDLRPVLFEACKYLPGIELDLYDRNATNEIQQWLRGQIS